MESGEVKAVEVRYAVPSPKVRGNGALSDQVTPLCVSPEAGEGYLEALPDRLGRLPVLSSEELPRFEAGFDILVYNDFLGPEWHTWPSDASTLRQTPKQRWTSRVSPLNALGSLDCQSVLEAEVKRPIQPGAGGSMAGILQSR